MSAMATSGVRVVLSVATILLFLMLMCVSHVVSAQTQTEIEQAHPQTVETENPYPTEDLVADQNDVPGDFVVGPGKVELTINPGESQTIELLVSNRTGEKRQFNFTTEDIVGSSDVSITATLLGNDRGPYSLKDYISVPSTSFILNHNERSRIPVKVSVPKDAEPGGLYGAIITGTVAIESKPGNTGGTVPQSAVITRISTLFFITIPGDIEHEGALKDFMTVPESTFYQSGPMTFGMLFENTGSIHLAPYGEIRVKNMFGEEVGFEEIDPWYVLPQAQRLREISWNREFLFGKYTATVRINRSYSDIIDEMSYTFWVLPWKLILGVFVALYLVIFLIRAFFRNFEFKRKE